MKTTKTGRILEPDVREKSFFHFEFQKSSQNVENKVKSNLFTTQTHLQPNK